MARRHWNGFLDYLSFLNNIFCKNIVCLPEALVTVADFCDHIYFLWFTWFQGLIGSYTGPYWRSGISSTSVRYSVFSRVEHSRTSGKTLNFSHEWKKSQIFNKDEYKYLFLPFQLKNKACRFHSFIRMSMSCLLQKILQRHVQCSKYTLIQNRIKSIKGNQLKFR